MGMGTDTNTGVDHTAQLNAAGTSYRDCETSLATARLGLIAAIRAAATSGMYPTEIARACGWSRAQVNNVRGVA